MINADKITAINNLIQESSTILLLLRSQPTLDQVLGALAFADSLQGAGKSVEVACTDLGYMQESSDFDVSLIRQKVGSRNLTISFPYTDQSVENVSYHINEAGDRFYLVVKPQKGYEPLASEEVEFDYTGVDADLLITVGVHDLNQLEYIYTEHELLFRNTPLISLHTFETETTRFHLDTSGFGSISEGLVWFMEALSLAPSSQGATYLLKGIEEATDSFRSLAATADTFESVAKLMRMGARRSQRTKLDQLPQSQKSNVEASTDILNSSVSAPKATKKEKQNTHSSSNVLPSSNPLPSSKPLPKSGEQMTADLQTTSGVQTSSNAQITSKNISKSSKKLDITPKKKLL